MRNIRIGVVGAGTNTKLRHIPGLQKIEGVAVTTVCNRNPQSSKKAAQEMEIPEIAQNWREVVLSNDIDAIVVGTWPYLHCPITLAALENGKHVMVEARMAMNSYEAKKMLDLSVRHPELVAQVVPSPMTLKVDATINDLINSGFFGEVVAVEVRALSPSFPQPDAPLHWRDNRDLSGNNIMSLGIWYEAVMRWIGSAKKVSATGQTFVRARKNEEDNLQTIEIPDHLSVTAKMHRGCYLHMFISTVAGPEFDGPQVRIFGTEGSVCYSNDTLCGVQKGQNAYGEILISEEKKSGWRVEEEFVRAIRGLERIKLTSFETGVKYMEFTDAVQMSLRSEKSISLPLLNG